jgi:hypothetical protein
MIRMAVCFVRLWTRLTTVGLEACLRSRIRDEVEADLWEQANSKDGAVRPATEALTILLRCILGMPADVRRLIEEPGLGFLTMGATGGRGVVERRRLWLNSLVVLGVSLSFVFLVITPLIMAIVNRR